MCKQRKFVFLQGPHGPYFSNLGRKLVATGAQVERIGFTFADHVFWHKSLDYTAFSGTEETWPAYLKDHILKNEVTDIVLYGDSRPLHQTARVVATQLDITVHCFEEGYLRPYWATYERGGTNGNSALIGISVPEMLEAVKKHPVDLPEVPVQWGAIWHHAFYGFLYHLLIAFPTPRYRKYRPHREITVLRELLLYIRRLAIMPVQGVQRRWRTRRLLRSGAIYHLVLLQLSHDASLRSHSDIPSVGAFIKMVIGEFAIGAPAHHRLVFKAHPFEDEREPLPRLARAEITRLGLQDRVQYIPGGKLGPLLDGANSTVTVNSTAAQQALWRGLPIKALGRSVFLKPEFVSEQPLAEFFANPDTPDGEAYRGYRQFLLESSQIAGGFYTKRGRAELLRRVVDLILSPNDPYEVLLDRQQPTPPELKAV
ncbi:MAG: capsule biosynthesis protein CapA [Paracoccaceae bacterium]